MFSGLQSTTFWLLFSGAVMGAAIGHTGLGKRAAAILSRMLGRRYAGVIAGIVLFSVALAFVMRRAWAAWCCHSHHPWPWPSISARRGHNGRTGMLMAASFSSFLPTFAILPSNAPNMILSGMADICMRADFVCQLSAAAFSRAGISVRPVVLLILWMFRRRSVRAAAPAQRQGPMSAQETGLAVVLGVCLALWMTDGLHHGRGLGRLAAALVCLWPAADLTSKNA